MIKNSALLFCLTLTRCIWGAFDYPASSSRNAGVANSYISSTKSLEAFLINPALSVNNETIYGKLCFYRLFNLKELTHSTGIIAFQIAKFNWGIAVHNFGDQIYKENKFTINLSKNVDDDKFSLGLSLNYYLLNVLNYENMSTLGIDIGIRYQISSNIWMGMAVSNINQPKLNDYSEQIPQTIQLGLQYKVLNPLLFHFSIQKDAWFTPSLSLAVEYNISDYLEISTGFSSDANIPTGGIVINISKLKIDYAIQYHFDLGPTHFIGIAYASI
jgi:hypothetical protein